MNFDVSRRQAKTNQLFLILPLSQSSHRNQSRDTGTSLGYFVKSLTNSLCRMERWWGYVCTIETVSSESLLLKRCQQFKPFVNSFNNIMATQRPRRNNSPGSSKMKLQPLKATAPLSSLIRNPSPTRRKHSSPVPSPVLVGDTKNKLRRSPDVSSSEHRAMVSPLGMLSVYFFLHQVRTWRCIVESRRLTDDTDWRSLPSSLFAMAIFILDGITEIWKRYMEARDTFQTN